MSIFLQLEENETDCECSKFFGEIAIPEKWLDENVFSPEELFVCQINLAELNLHNKELEQFNGTLFFFIDMKKSPYKAVVRYFEGESDACLSFNDDAECEENVIDELSISFSEDKNDNLCEMFVRNENTDGNIAILAIGYDKEDPLLPICGDVYFLISENDLQNGNFNKAKLKVVKK